MNFSDIFRSFLGLNRGDNSRGGSGHHNDFRNPIWNVDDDDDTEDELHHGFGRRSGGNMFPNESFSVFSDPLEMARYAEHQMERMMSVFNSIMGQQFGDNFPLPPKMPELSPDSSLPAIEGKKDKSIRDEYLKPGYLKPSATDKVDTDLDKEISRADLNSLLDNFGDLQIKEPSTQNVKKYAPKGVNPYSNNVFFTKVITRSITHPDGTVETTRTVTNSDGTEETTKETTQGPFKGFSSSFFGF